MGMRQARQAGARRGVIITGAGGGIGAATARLLAERGIRVFAGMRDVGDGGRLKDRGVTAEPVPLDVTAADSVAGAAALVRERLGADGRLTGIVNNAGIGLTMPMEYVDIGMLRRLLEVNVIGAAAVTVAFMPLLERPGGRIVNVSSISGLLATALAGPYCASKFALEAMSDAMRVEVRKQGLYVSLIEPGVIDTGIHEKNRARAERALGRMTPEGRSRYASALETLDENTRKYERGAVAPGAVAKAIHDALTAGKPRARYPVTAQAKLISLMGPFLPTRMRDRISGLMTGL